MSKYYKLLTFLTFLIFALFVLMFSPQQAHATTLNDIFTSPDSFIVKIQERIEYFFAFSTEQKVVVLEKQAERRLERAENLVQMGDIDKISSLIKSYETLKEKQGDLIGKAPTTVLAEVKEHTVQQQARIEDIKKDLPEGTKEIIENSQRTVIKTVIDNLQDESGTTEIENEANEFAEEVKNVLDPGSNIFAPGTNVILKSVPEVAPGSPGIDPGTKEVVPGNVNLAP